MPFEPDPFAYDRHRMVEQQLRGRGITDERVLAAMARVPRHRFLSDISDYEAYGDHPIPIGSGQTISQPYMVALMTQCLALQGEAYVLEVGTGSGYQAAILAELAAQVYTIERHSELAERARLTLQELGYQNVEVTAGDGTLGWPEHAPYDGIIVTAGTPSIPQPWVDQLADGGRLVAPVGDRYAQNLIVGEKRGRKLTERAVCTCVFVPLIGRYGWPE